MGVWGGEKRGRAEKARAWQGRAGQGRATSVVCFVEGKRRERRKRCSVEACNGPGGVYLESGGSAGDLFCNCYWLLM